ncbi:MAG: hypothetical protein ABSF38_11675 [Verrucomicrobiota bacterium]
MPHPHHGKIARLPHLLREQIHSRLRDGQPAKQIVAWLNSLPEVQALLAAAFAARPISQANFSQWKKRSHGHWLLRQEVLAQAPLLLAQSRQLSQAGQGEITDHLATVVSASYALAFQRLGEIMDPIEHWKFLHALCRDVVALRRGDHSVQWLRLHREQLQSLPSASPNPPPSVP